MKIERLLRNTLIMLAVMYALGMYAAMYVSFPESVSNEGEYYDFAWTHWPTALHMALAIGILINSIALLVKALRQSNRALRNVVLAGTIAVIVAFVDGALFVRSQNDAYSFVMSLGFLVAFAAYGWAWLAPRSSNK